MPPQAISTGSGSGSGSTNLAESVDLDDIGGVSPTAPTKYCGGAIELEDYLHRLELNFRLHPQYFENEARKVDYALSYLGTWVENPDPKLAKLTHKQDPITWATILAKSGNKPVDFDAFKRAIRRQFGDPTPAGQYVKEALDNYVMLKGEGVRDYEARFKALWMRTGVVWSDEGDATARHAPEYVLYLNAYSGMHAWIKKAINPLAPIDVKQFASLRELFERAACAEALNPGTRVAVKTSVPAPHRGGYKRGNKERGRGDRSDQSRAATTFNDMYHKRQKTGGASSNDTRPRAPFVAIEVFKARIMKGECTRCGRTGHHGSECRTYRRAARPRSRSIRAGRSAESTSGW